ncbi:MAG: PEGA domain-containing protein [Chitinivibrionales bacterium]|nr:PEGA domain-containing protein [Chitinivibrionales bacterium]
MTGAAWSLSLSVAIKEVSSVQSADSSLSLAVTQAIISEIRGYPFYHLIEQSTLQENLRHHQFQFNSSCDTLGCLLYMGGILKAERIISGTVTTKDGHSFITMRFVDINGAALIGMVHNEFTAPEEIREIVSGLVRKSGDKKYLDSVTIKSTATKRDSVTNGSLQPQLSVSVEPATSICAINNKQFIRGGFAQFPLTPGVVSIHVVAAGYVPYQEIFTLKTGQQKSIDIKLTSIFGAVDIEAQPQDVACITFNGYPIGAAFFENSTIKPGSYPLLISAPTYEPVIDTLQIIPNTLLQRNYELHHTKAFQDSLFHQALVQKQWQNPRRFMTAACAIASLGAGIYFDGRVKYHMRQYRTAALEYEQAKSNFEVYKKRYYAARDEAQAAVQRRNAVYGVSTIFSAGFCISLFF